MCCDYNFILIIFIILYNIIDVYNRHIKIKEEYKTKNINRNIWRRRTNELKKQHIG